MSHFTLSAPRSLARIAIFCAGVVGLPDARIVAAQPADSPPVPGEQSEGTEELEKARVHFLQGVQFYNNGDYKISLIEFRRSYELSANYRILYNIGQVNQQLGNYTKALVALEQYLAEGGAELPDDRKSEVSTSVALLQKRVAHIRLVSNVTAAEVLVDGFPASASGPNAAITVDPGDHRVDLRKTGYQPAGTVITVAGGDVMDVRLELNKIESAVALSPSAAPPAAPARDTTWMWIGWTTTGAAALGAGVTGVLASMQASDLAELRNSPSSTQAQRDEVGRRGKTFAIASDVLTATAIAAGAASLYITLRPAKSEPERRTMPALRIGLSPAGVSLRQTF